jgi:integrase/recombinase XerD
MKIAKKQVRIIKKIREASGVWRFISLQRVGSRYVWDDRPGHYFLDWREGRKRKREYAGGTPAEATESQRRKRNELIGAMISQGNTAPTAENESFLTIARAREMFLDHVRAHSPDKPETVRRYEQVLNHFERILGNKKYVEAIDRSDIDTYKIKRSAEKSLRHDRQITPRTINFEVSTLRTFFYYLENERGLNLKNPCAKFKHLKDQKKKAKAKPPVYSQEQINHIFAQCGDVEKTIFATLLLTGLRKRELYFLSWHDLDLDRGILRVTGDNKEGFSPKDYEERVIPIPADLVELLKKLSRKSQWVFCNANGGRISHLLRRGGLVTNLSHIWKIN